MSEIRPPKMCGLFKPGHNPHWIQVNRAREDIENTPATGRFIRSQGEGSVMIAVDGREVHLWNHESERLVEAAAASGGVVMYQQQWGLLWVPSKSGRYAFCVARFPIDQAPASTTTTFKSPSEAHHAARPSFGRAHDCVVAVS